MGDSTPGSYQKPASTAELTHTPSSLTLVHSHRARQAVRRSIYLPDSQKKPEDRGVMSEVSQSLPCCLRRVPARREEETPEPKACVSSRPPRGLPWRRAEQRVWSGLLLHLHLPHPCPALLGRMTLFQDSPTKWPDPFTKPRYGPQRLPSIAALPRRKPQG